MKTYTIGEIAHQMGINTSTIRYYEQIGLLLPAQRLNGKRRYDSGIISKLKIIQMAQQAGFTIAEIHTLLHEFPENTPPSIRWQALATDKIAQLEEQSRRIQIMKSLLESTLSCQCVTLESCVDD